jgi:hypothetical protein
MFLVLQRPDFRYQQRGLLVRGLLQVAPVPGQGKIGSEDKQGECAE